MRPRVHARRSRLAFVVLFLPVLALAGGDAKAAAPRPDIVVIYMDDFAPEPERLWADRLRTPSLSRFVDHGIRLNASGSTPQCCPARANLLTGRYGHRNGVTSNDIHGYDPARSVAIPLARAGYHTAFIGKFMNGLRSRAPSRRAVARHARGWDVFDVIWENNGRYYDYRRWTRRGSSFHGHQARDHSSRVSAIRAARHIRRAPRRKPLFMVVSVFDGHEPITPMPRFKRHPACRRVRPWAPASFDEADVSDKPRYVRRHHRLRREGSSLRSRCEAIMTTDWVTQRVRGALRREGRLEDTLLVFTSDNGMLMGEHRLVGKTYPYATPVPMYALWPRRWGREPRVIRDPVSNVDLAPTFCRLAGCRLRGADGRNITPLLDGSVSRLDRRFIYEEMLHPGVQGGGRPAWYGIRTTLGYSDRLWVYTEYATGEKELYDLTADPYQLRNLARRRAFADVRADLRRLLWREVIRPHRVRFRTHPTN
jgi:N-acetylglucosamine-6-sulfatase